MSTIRFNADKSEQSFLKRGVWDMVKEHYFTSVYPNTLVKFDYEGEDIYLERLEKLMQEELCEFKEEDDCLIFEFDSTEDAGFSIADSVYHTPMGYSDNGLTYLDGLFVNIARAFPNITFESETECSDEWVCYEPHYAYDGKKLRKNGKSIRL